MRFDFLSLLVTSVFVTFQLISFLISNVVIRSHDNISLQKSRLILSLHLQYFLHFLRFRIRRLGFLSILVINFFNSTHVKRVCILFLVINNVYYLYKRKCFKWFQLVIFLSRHFLQVTFLTSFVTNKQCFTINCDSAQDETVDFYFLHDHSLASPPRNTNNTYINDLTSTHTIPNTKSVPVYRNKSYTFKIRAQKINEKY